MRRGTYDIPDVRIENLRYCRHQTGSDRTFVWFQRNIGDDITIEVCLIYRELQNAFLEFVQQPCEVLETTFMLVETARGAYRLVNELGEYWPFEVKVDA